MGTLDELVYYCSMEHPAGALALLGESGSGKSWLVEKELQEALKDTHVVVRVSLFGIGSVSALNDAVRRQWMYALLPVSSKHIITQEQITFGKKFINAVNAILKLIRPKAAAVGDTASRILDDISVLPVVEDVRTHTQKKVVLVFDDADSASIRNTDLLGVINDYRENRGFHVIVVGNRESFHHNDAQTEDFIRTAKEKSITYMVYSYPDFRAIISSLIPSRSWHNEAYDNYLQEHTEAIIDLFGDVSPYKEETGDAPEKCHNLRSLITGLERFYRIYSHLNEEGVQDIEPYLCSFLAFWLAEKGGVRRNGKTGFTFTDEELAQLYPSFKTEYLPDSVRDWIQKSYWDEEKFNSELERMRKE